MPDTFTVRPHVDAEEPDHIVEIVFRPDRGDVRAPTHMAMTAPEALLPTSPYSLYLITASDGQQFLRDSAGGLVPYKRQTPPVTEAPAK